MAYTVSGSGITQVVAGDCPSSFDFSKDIPKKGGVVTNTYDSCKDYCTNANNGDEDKCNENCGDGRVDDTSKPRGKCIAAVADEFKKCKDACAAEYPDSFIGTTLPSLTAN